MLVLAAVSVAQDGFGFKRPIDQAPEGWARIKLPEDIFSKLEPTFDDLRIFERKSGGQPAEIPYILRRPEPRKVTSVDFSVINSTSAEDRYFYTFDAGRKTPVNRIELKFSNPNFERSVLLEGSQDLEKWESVLKEYRILSVKNDQADFSLTTLNFPTAVFRYYRISFTSPTDPGNLSASVLRIEDNPGAVRQYEVASHKVTRDEDEKTTNIEIRLENKVPVTSVSLPVSDEGDYYRNISVTCRTGTDASNRDLFSESEEGVISSFGSDAIEFPETVTDLLKVVVEDGDNEPLLFRQPVVSGTAYDLLVRFPSAGEYELYYSKPSATKAEYDLAHFVEKAPVDLPILALGPEKALKAVEAEPSPSPRWMLWIAMAAAAALMLWFAMSLVRKSSKGGPSDEMRSNGS